MNDPTPRLGLPTVGDHAQKRIVMNDALMRLDRLVQAQVLSRTVTAQPSTPADGDSYILPVGATGAAWSVLTTGSIVRAEDGTWEAVAFPSGGIVHLADENRFLIRSGSGWVAFEDALKALDNLTHLGINATADSTNVLTAKGPAALLTARYAADGGSGDLSLSLNKEADGDTVQILLQKNYTSRAILGLLSDNNLTLKVSPDGATFLTALGVEASSGKFNLANGAATAPQLAFNSNYGLYYEPSSLQSGSVALGLALNGDSNVQFARDTASGIIRLIAAADAGVNNLVWTFSTSASPAFVLRRSRGTRASSAYPSANDTLGSINFAGGSTSSNVVGAQITTTVIEATPSSSALGTQLSISLCQLGSATRSEAMRLEYATGLSMYGANPVIDQNRNLRTRLYTVATLPSAATAAGQRAQVSDASSPAFAASVSGGGATHSPVYSDGSTWRCG